jgi:uncharacterized protein (TIGR02391 family)
MLDMSLETIVQLPVDELGLMLLTDVEATRAWSEHNYINLVSKQQPESARAVAEGFAWLRSRGLIARTPGQTEPSAIFITRAGHQALENGLAQVRAAHLLQEGLHPLVEQRARRQFLLGEYEQAVLVAMKAVEVRVRELGGFGNDAYGVDIMNKAFGPTGPLTDPNAPKSEQDGTRFLFAGAYAVLRNPSAHREVNYDDVAEAAEAVVTSSLLMRILDRIEVRKGE